uniref:Uncharacterized protein n=1 Tax=Timema genevievae TaxID=629358 RepID=A0A7R9K7Y8_TIMGE|nr:unnamed protein product [Timema genevievae]
MLMDLKTSQWNRLESVLTKSILWLEQRRATPGRRAEVTTPATRPLHQSQPRLNQIDTEDVPCQTIHDQQKYYPPAP